MVTITFELWQLPVVEDVNNGVFMDYKYFTKHGITPSKENYKKVYARTDSMEEFILTDYLEDRFMEFNIRQPADYFWRSLSVSDVLVVNGTAYFCDNFGWQELKTF